MDFNVKQSLTYFFKDRTCISKAVIFFFLAIASTIVPCVGPFLFFVLLLGYLFFVSNLRILKPEDNLPKFDFKIAFITGIKFFVFSIICGIAFFIANLISSFIPFLGIVLMFLFLMIELIILDTAVVVYTVNLNFKSLFKLETYKKILVQHFNNYIKMSIIKCIIAIPVIIMCTVLCILSLSTLMNTISAVYGVAFAYDFGIEANAAYIMIGSLVLHLLIVYTSIAYADINAQFIRQMNGIEIEEKDENTL